MSNEAKCSCQFCDGHIAFPAEMAGQMFACPHCGLATKLFTPDVAKAPASQNLPQTVSVEKRGVSPLGIASLVLGIMACVICWIPFLGLFAIPVALIGLVLAFIGVVIAAMNKKTDFVFSISGGIVCILSVCIALVTTGTVAKLYSDSKRTNQTPVATSGASVPSNSEWSKNLTVKQGDIQIEISGIEIYPLWINAANDLSVYPYSKENYLQFQIKVKNIGLTKKIDFQTWRGTVFKGNNAAILKDNNGNQYKQIAVSPDFTRTHREETTLYPTDSFADVLVFEKPVPNIKWLHLELSAENFGGTGMLRFEIPASKSDIERYGQDSNIFSTSEPL